MITRFDTIHQSDRQTKRQTPYDGVPRLCIRAAKIWWYVKPFRYSTWTWLTDGWTDRIAISISHVSIAVLTREKYTNDLLLMTHQQFKIIFIEDVVHWPSFLLRLIMRNCVKLFNLLPGINYQKILFSFNRSPVHVFVLLCYDTVGWVIWLVKPSPKLPIMCPVGR